MKKAFIVFGFLLQMASVSAQVSAPIDSSELGAPVVWKKEVVVTAQRQRHDAYELPVLTTVLDAKYLKNRIARSVPELLFEAPGVFLQKTNHGGGSLFLRGLTGQQTLLLVDGIRLNNATFRSGPNQYLNTIDPAWLQRVEILESGGASEYGSDAIGGVVNLITHALQYAPQTTFRPEAAVKWMSGGMENSAQAALRGSGKRWALRAGGAYRQFGDLIAGKGLGKQAPNGYDQWSLEAKAQFQLNRQVSVTAAYQDLLQQDVPVYHKVQLENFAYNSFDPQRRQLVYARLQADFSNNWWRKIEWTASRQLSYEVRKSQKNGNPVQVTETDKTWTNGLQINVLSKIRKYWDMTTGMEWYGDAVRSDKVEWNENSAVQTRKRGLYPDRSSMQSWAAYNLHTLSWKRINLAGGLRYNGFRIVVPDETIGTATVTPSALVGNLGISWACTPGLRLYANTATAFRAPNVDDLGTLGIVDFRYELPNYQLKPEKSHTIEAGIKVNTRNLQASFSAYHLRLYDLIGRIRTSDSLQGYPVYQKENITEAYVRGLEGQVKWYWNKNLLLAGHGAYTFGQNTSAAEPLRRIPPFNGRVYLQYTPWARVGLRAESVFASAQRRLAKADVDDNRIADDGTPGWSIFNLAASYQYRFYSLHAEFHNIGNEAYRTHGSGVDGMGRSVWIRLSLQF